MECATLDAPEDVVITETLINPTCNDSNGSISLSTNISDATYAWSMGATTANLQNLSAGNYSVTVTDANTGCTATETYILINEGDLSVSLTPMNPICVGADNGMVTANAQYTGSGSLIYSWNTGATTAKISDLPSGEYCVTVTSSEGCVDEMCTILTAPIAVTANAIIVSAGCNMEDGKIKLIAAGGTAPYAYKWENGETTKEIKNLAPGEYCATVCDAVGCIFEGCFIVSGGADFTSTVVNSDLACFGDTNASAMATVNGGTAPFTYVWSNGATGSTVNNLGAGDYCVSITDVFGCMDVSCGNIAAPVELSLTTTATNTTCNDANGSASINVNFTNPSISWNGPAGFTASTISISNLAAGTYSVTATNNAGCEVTGSVTIAPSDDLSISIDPFDNTICPGESINLNTASSVANGVVYTWSANGGTFSSNTGSSTVYTMMTSGTYTITVMATDAQGCISTAITTVIVRDENDPICNPNTDLVNIGDYVWFDINNNGIQDTGELGIEGVEVKLMTAGPDGVFYTADDVTVLTEVTDPTGYYLFEDVVAGEYVIMFCIDTLSGIEYTSQNIGANDGVDSDANPANGKTDPFTIVAGQADDLSFDAGVILSPMGCDNITSGGSICCDQILCGAGSIPELISSTILPSGGSGDIEYLWMSTTTGGPFDMDTWDVIVGADAASYQPGAIFETTFIARCSRRAGCTSYRESNIIKLEIAPLPAATIQSLPAFICVGESDMFNATSAGTAVTYTWDLGEGANPATASGQYLTNVVWNSVGSKTITLTIESSACTFVTTRTVQVGDCLSQPNNNRFTNLTAVNVPETMDIDLKWNTKDGMNDYKFVIEHSTEGENFNILNTIDGNDAFEIKDYSYMDKNARPGRNYYRIKHINNNGKTEKSEIRMVMLTDRVEKYIVFPNPTQDFIIFESLKLSEKPGSIMISDMKGVVLKEVVIQPNSKRNVIDISHFVPGMYTLRIKYVDAKATTQLIYKSDK